MRIEDVREGDEIVSDVGVLRKVTRLLVRNYRGGLRKIKLRKLSGVVELTDDHKVLRLGGAKYTQQYKYFSKRYNNYLQCKEDEYYRKCERYFPIEKVKASELLVQDKLLYPILREVIDVEELDVSLYAGNNKRGLKPRALPSKVKINDQLLKLLGYYIAEGSNHRAYIRFSLGNNEEDFALEIQNIIFDLFKLESSIYRCKGRKSGIEVTCCNAALARLFENLCGKGAANKHIPYDFNLLPTNKQKIILEAIWRGDGTDFVSSKSNNIVRSITTISRELIVQLRDILLRINIFPSEHKINERITKDGVHHRESYTIYWSDSGYEKYNLVYTTRSGNKYWILPIASISKSIYRDKVYNLTVENEHTYTAENFAVGNCQEGGDVLTFLQKYDGMSFLEALEMLAKKVGITLISYRPTSDDLKRKRMLEIMSLAGEYYRFLLTKHESGAVAREYLRTRGIVNESVEKFGLGYAPPQWRSVSEFLTKKKGYSNEELEAVGLVIKSGEGKYYDRFRGRVMFPLRDHKGVIVGFSGRILEKDAKEAKYINSPETAIYHKSRMLYGLWENREAIRKDDKIVLVEGELDVIPSVQAGAKSVVAIKGSAFTEEQAQLIARYTRNVYMSLDADSAGQEAIKRAVQIADKLDLSIRVVQIKGGKDPGDVATENARAWREMVASAVLYWDFLIDSVSAKVDPKTGEGAEAITREVVPALAQISNMVIKAHYAKKLAQVLHVPEDSIYGEIERVSKKRELTYLKDTVTKIEKGMNKRGDELAIYALALLLQHFPQLREKVGEVESGWISVPAVTKIMGMLEGWQGEIVVSEFVKKMPEELMSVFDQAYMRDISSVTDPTREWEKTRKELEELYVRERLKETTKLIGQLEGEEGEKLEQLKTDFGRLSRRLAELAR